MNRPLDKSWNKIFSQYGIYKHDFKLSPFAITAAQIKSACQEFTKTGAKEPRILCKQDTREKRPSVFIENGLFLLPVKNGKYIIIKGEGYVDIPKIETAPINYKSELEFKLDTSLVGNSEMQHLDFAYASSLIRTFMNDSTLVLTIRGRKYTPRFSFYAGGHKIDVESVQTEVDAGYEGREQVVLIEAKNQDNCNTIIRQLYYPFRQWKSYTDKKVLTLFFERKDDLFFIWQFGFMDVNNYNSIKLLKCACYKITGNP